jgi:hypothetical protein
MTEGGDSVEVSAVIDLGDLGPAAAVQPKSEAIDLGDVGPAAAVQPTTEPYSPERTRENFRGRVALLLMILLAALAAGMVIVTVALVRPFDRETIGLLIAGIFGPIVGLVGTVVGFYFGQISAGDAIGSSTPTDKSAR